MRTFRKYEFGSKALPPRRSTPLVLTPKEPLHIHTLSCLGHIVTTPATYDADGNVDTAAVLSDNYHVDVLWNGEPDPDWDNQLVWCAPMGVHMFRSSSAIAEWVAECKVQRPELFPEPEEED